MHAPPPQAWLPGAAGGRRGWAGLSPPVAWASCPRAGARNHGRGEAHQMGSRARAPRPDHVAPSGPAGQKARSTLPPAREGAGRASAWARPRLPHGNLPLLSSLRLASRQTLCAPVSRVLRCSAEAETAPGRLGTHHGLPGTLTTCSGAAPRSPGLGKPEEHEFRSRNGQGD